MEQRYPRALQSPEWDDDDDDNDDNNGGDIDEDTQRKKGKGRKVSISPSLILHAIHAQFSL